MVNSFCDYFCYCYDKEVMLCWTLILRIYTSSIKTQKCCPLLGRLTAGGLYGDKKIEISQKTITVTPLRHSSIVLFEQFIREYSWSFVLNAAHVDDGVRSFLEATNSMFDTFFACKSMKVCKDYIPYIIGRIKEMMYNRNKACQRGLVERFKYLWNKTVSEIRKEKNKFYDKRIKPLNNHNPKLGWRQIRKVVGSKQDSISLQIPKLKTH